MIDTIKKVVEAQRYFENVNEKLEEFYDVSVSPDERIQYLQLGRFIADSKEMEVLHETRESEVYPHRYSFEHAGYNFFIVMTDEDNEIYKKATAETVAREKKNQLWVYLIFH